MNNTTAKSPLQKNRMLYLDIARTIAIISITLNHAVNRAYDNYRDPYSEHLSLSTFATLVKTIATVFSHIGVPLFLMITGVLILNKTFENNYDIKRFFKNNWLPIFITTQIWFFIMFWFIMLVKPAETVLSSKGLLATVQKLLETMLFINHSSEGVEQTIFGSMWYMPMILSLYILVPFLALAVKNFSAKVIFIPLFLSFIITMLIPELNSFLILQGHKVLSFGIYDTYVLSYFLIYIVLGYYINKSGFKRLNDFTVLLLTLLSFTGCCAYQLYAYSKPQNYLIGYSFPGILVCTVFLFELIKRKQALMKRFSKVFEYISKISFAIYFLHVLICWFMHWFFDFSGHKFVKMCLIEIVSVGGSIIIIAIFSKIKIFKKYLFMIKD